MKYSASNYTESCPVCRLPCVFGGHTNQYEITCSCCGMFRVTKRAYTFLIDHERPVEQTACASWFLSRNPGFVIDEKSRQFLEELRGPDLPQRGAGLLIALAEAYPRPGDIIKDDELRVNSELLDRRSATRLEEYRNGSLSEDELRTFKWLAASASPNRKELDWLIKHYLIDSGYLVPTEPRCFGIGPAGWRQIEALRSPNQQSKDAFVAMSFNERYLPLYDQAFHPGILGAGYSPVRIDRTEHNNRIDDEIIASIRKSRFVVADLSMHRGGIYFEAGFALGLGLPVVWTVEKRALDQNEVHFDNRQYNFLVWEDGKYDDLARRLTNRIEATIGRPLMA